jgi:hypothetical protein
MKIPAPLLLGCSLLSALALRAAPDPSWIDHDRLRPMATPIDPGTPSTEDKVGVPPSDATVLFGGQDDSQWCAMDGSPTKWLVKNGEFVCVPGSGYARTQQCFGDCQLHVEWAAPNPPHGESQGRGNSGVFFGYGRYEIQVLDSYQSKTYADGAAAAVYGQYPPLVNATRPPGMWQTYDVIWTAPRFSDDGKLLCKARITLFHNGVLVQNNVELTGPTGWINRIPYEAHPERSPIALQDHGHPVRFRNIWVRELNTYHHKEYLLPDTLLDTYVGTYGTGHHVMKVTRLGADGLLNLHFEDRDLVLHAESQTKFYALSTDVQCEFVYSGATKRLDVTVGEDEEHPMSNPRVDE